MGSNDALRTVFDLRIISIFVVIALLVGAGAGYMVGNSPVSSLMEEIDQLEAECDSLDLAVQDLADELDSTQELLVEEQRDVALLEQRYMEMLVIDKENLVLIQQVIDLEAENEYLNLSYEGIIETMELFRVSNFSRRTELNLSAGPTKTYRYDIGYGIIWEVTVEFTGRTLGYAMSWIRGDKRGSEGGMGASLTESPSNVNILIQLDIYDTGGNDITVSCDAECLEFPWISKSSGGRFAKIPPT
ncbi:hypothetical protein ES703_54853 [subsurface metagenome]